MPGRTPAPPHARLEGRPTHCPRGKRYSSTCEMAPPRMGGSKTRIPPGRGVPPPALRAQGEGMQTPTVPTTSPVAIAPDTFLIPHLAPVGPDGFVHVNSMLIRGEEPIIVDTGAPIHRESWLEQVFSLVEPEDVRWVFLSHDDGD